MKNKHVRKWDLKTKLLFKSCKIPYALPLFFMAQGYVNILTTIGSLRENMSQSEA
jgi:hypothetical protein